MINIFHDKTEKEKYIGKNIWQIFFPTYFSKPFTPRRISKKTFASYT